MKYYLECVECDQVIDFWKYEGIEDTDHEGHKLRELDKRETIAEAQDCFDDGCLKQEHMGKAESQRQELLEMIKNV